MLSVRSSFVNAANDPARQHVVEASSTSVDGAASADKSESRRMRETPQERSSRLIPRFTLIEADYPQIVAASAGGWLLLETKGAFHTGVVGDLQVGLSGPMIALGVGATSEQTTSNEHATSFGLQGVMHRTWPWWDPVLPTSATFAGAELFGHFFIFRCSLGIMWKVGGGQTGPSPIPMGGCGLGLP